MFNIKEFTQKQIELGHNLMQKRVWVNHGHLLHREKVLHDTVNLETAVATVK